LSPARITAGLASWYARRTARPGWRRDLPLDRTLRSVARLWARLELPLAVRLLETLRVNRQDLWADAGFRECRGVWHGYRLRLDLSDFYQRWAYFLSRYHEIPLQVLLRHALRRGDVFIDGGANNGLVSLVAAWLVGPTGRVCAFEPNPRAFEQLLWHSRTNCLPQIVARCDGLSDAAESLHLQVPGADNLGAGTFSRIPNRYHGQIAVAAAARTIRADCISDLPTTGLLAVKLDVEGFELRAIRGLGDLIPRRLPLIITEINREMLLGAGSSPFELFQEMHARGYLGYGFDTRAAFIRHRLPTLWRVPTTGPRLPRDIAWIHPDSEASRRLHRFVAEPAPPGAPGAAT
jgi:FkbM family methyltransferase